MVRASELLQLALCGCIGLVAASKVVAFRACVVGKLLANRIIFSQESKPRD
jgi:hypothetical protein